MPRWGLRIFEGDVDINLAIEVGQDIAQGEEPHLALLMAMILRKAPPPVQDYYDAEWNYKALKRGARAVTIREELDAGLGVYLLRGYRDEILRNADTQPEDGPYRIIILSVMMMMVGARISDDDLGYIRQLVPTIHCRETYARLRDDSGFRGPGKRQLLAALDNYTPGTPRSFVVPSCHGCGKMQTDLGAPLWKCGGCLCRVSEAYYCSKACQDGLWDSHKQHCGERLDYGSTYIRRLGRRESFFIEYDGVTI